MEEAANILFWITFVGVIIFILFGMYATFCLRQYKYKNFGSYEVGLTYLSASLTIIFVVIAVNHNIQHQDINYQHTPVTPVEQTYKPFGNFIMYDTNDNKNDTITLYRKNDNK